MVKELCDLNPNQRGVIVKVGCCGKVRRRMIDMGLVTGAEVEVVRYAPLGDPIELNVKGYNLSLRKEEAQGVQVEMSDQNYSGNEPD
jgi:ferrous iron transport protein A